MLHSIRTKPRAAPSHEPVDMLLDCHARLRHFSAMASALATRTDLDEKQIEDACTELVRYFEVALPLHEADEERTLAPALEPLAADAEALERMRSQHAAIHETLDALIPLWKSRRREETAGGARELAALLEDHLALEESVIFPLVAKLAAAERERLGAEMRARRAF